VPGGRGSRARGSAGVHARRGEEGGARREGKGRKRKREREEESGGELTSGIKILAITVSKTYGTMGRERDGREREVAVREN
jgi:hypothetical protein